MDIREVGLHRVFVHQLNNHKPTRKDFVQQN